MSDKNAKKNSVKNNLKASIEAKMIELILSLDPAMKEKKVLRRAKKAAKIIGRGVKQQNVVLVSEVLEINPQ